MTQNLIMDVLQLMLPHLDNAQSIQLQQVLEHVLFRYEVSPKVGASEDNDKGELVQKFLAAKRIEGCSEKTLKYYQSTIEAMLQVVSKGAQHIQTEDLRTYLTEYQSSNGSSRVTIDNIRRILSSFFSWLEDENYILKSPARRIHKVKTAVNVK